MTKKFKNTFSNIILYLLVSIIVILITTIIEYKYCEVNHKTFINTIDKQSENESHVSGIGIKLNKYNKTMTIDRNTGELIEGTEPLYTININYNNIILFVSFLFLIILTISLITEAISNGKIHSN